MRLRKSGVIFLISVCLVFITSIVSCEIGMGAAVDIAVPTSGISYPPQNAVVRDTFIAAGPCDDDQKVQAVKVSVIDTENNKTYGPYNATLSEDRKSWSVSLNNKDPEKTTSRFDSYKQWELPDGNYVISAIAYDTADKQSAAATSPISIDNTAPVLIVSKPLAKGSEAATIYGSSLKLSGDIAEDHDTTKLVLNYAKCPDSSENLAANAEIKLIEITDVAELNAMSSSNPLIIAKYDTNNAGSPQHQQYLNLYGANADDVDRYYYCGFLLEDSALAYQNPGDSGEGPGNQTEQYYLLADDFQKILAVNYSLTAQRLMQIFKGKSDDYDQTQIDSIAAILTNNKNYSSSSVITKEYSSKFSLNPHNNPTWTLDEYGVTGGTIKSYTAGSSLILSLTAGRDASFPDPKTVTVDLYDITVLGPNGEIYAPSAPADFSTTGKSKIVLIGQGGKVAEKWDESADDTNKTKTFTLETEFGLVSNHYYKMDVKGTDRNKTDLEPYGGKEYVLRLSTSNNIPKVTIIEPASDKVFGTAAAYGNVNTAGVTISGYIVTDGVGLNGTNPIQVKVMRSDVAAGNPTDVSDDYQPDSTISSQIAPNTYPFNIVLKAKTANGKTFVPADESKYLYTVSVIAKDAADLSGEKQVKFYVDNMKPEVKINPVSPIVKEGTTEYVNGNITVSGVASDSGNTGSGLQYIRYTLDDGAPVTIAEATPTQSIPESWSFTLPTKSLTDNQTHTIKVTAVDTVGNQNELTGTAVKTFSLKQSTDTPSLNFSNAYDTVSDTTQFATVTANGTEYKNMFGTRSNNKLYGTITDDDGLGEFVIQYQKAGTGSKTKINPKTELTTDAKSYSFEYELPFTEAQQGEYQLFVTAKDKYAKLAETEPQKRETDTSVKNYDTLSKAFWIIVDDGAPELEDITVTPASINDYYAGSTAVSVTGKVKEGSGVVTLKRKIVKVAADGTETLVGTEQTVVLNVNGSNATADQIKTGITWDADTFTLPATSGKYKLTYSATDKYAQEQNYPIEFSVDVDNPNFSQLKIGSNTINTPYTAAGFAPWIADNTVTVEATVNDDETGTEVKSGVKEVSYTLDGTNWKSMMQSVSDESKWSADVSFGEGSNKTIKLRVTDNVGNTKETATFKVNIDKTKPTLEVKWYKISDNVTDGSLEEIPQTGTAPTAYVNSKDLVLFGNYTDGTNGSGVKALKFKVGSTTVTPDELTYYNVAFDSEADINTARNTATTVETDATKKKSFIAVINHSKWASATGDVNVTVSGSDKVDESDDNNTIHGVTKTAVTLKKDTGAPLVSGVVINQIKDSVTKTAYGPVNGNYYIRNKKDGKLKLEGTTTDSDGLVDYTIVTITGKGADGNTKTYTAKTNSGSWTLTKDDENNDFDLSAWKNNTAGQPDAVITITAYDKAGNSSAVNTNANCVKVLNLYFDEDAPAVLTGKVNGDDKPAGYDINKVSDKDDTSNPYSSDYTFRGKTAWKYGGIKIGNGKYGDTSYGRESSLKISVTFIGEANGSGVKKMEYRLLKASAATAYSNEHTGLYSGDIPSAASAVKEFTSIEADKYKHYGNNTDYDCYVGTETINGFEPTTDGTPNLLFVRAIDNCDNEGQWFVLLVQMDNEKPSVTSDEANPDSILTNGKSTLPMLKGTFSEGEHGAGLKTARVKIDSETVIYAGFTQKPWGLGEDDKPEDKKSGDKELKDALAAGLTITAKDAAGNAIDVSDLSDKDIYNKAVEVSFTNEYGTFTYKTKAESNGNRYSFKDASSKADWELTLTPQKADGTWTDWFTAIKNKANPQITIEAEDWAEDAASSGNKGTNIVSSLDIDVENPSVTISSPLNTKTLNGNQDISGTVTEKHTPKTVEIWYSNKTTAPAAFGTDNTSTPATAFKLLKKITVGDSLPDGKKVEEKDIYNFKYTHNFNDLLQSDASGNKIAGKVHIIIYAEDKAGNSNISKSTTITSTDYKTYNVDPDSDRPVVTVTNRNMVIKGGTDASPTYTPMSSSKYLMLNTNSLNIKLEDDDGIAEAKYRITKGAAVGNWTDFSDHIDFTDEGEQSLEFYIKDTQGGEYTSKGESYEGRATGKIYLKDTADPATRYGAATAGVDNTNKLRNFTQAPVIYADVDTNPPEIKKPIYAQLVKTAPASISAIDENKWESDLTKVHAGGPESKYLLLKLKAEDLGTGISDDGVSLSATLNVNGTAKPITQLGDTVKSGDYYYLTIPAFVLNAQNKEEEVEKADYIVTITVVDKAGRKATNSITLKADNKKPVIKITSPSKTENLSGIINIDGSITNENAVIEYAISTLEASPADYKSTTVFKYKNAETGAEVSLPANNKAGNPISPSKNLWELCKYTTFSDTSMMSFNFQLDGDDGTGHLDTLEDWIKNIGITTHDDLHTPDNPFNTIIQLYFHVRATDDSGNVNEEHYPIRVDPLGTRPTVSIGYPAKEKAGENTEGLVLGGKPTIIGTATGLNSVQYIWLQIDANSTDDFGEWDYQDVNTLRSKGYWIGKMSNNTQLTRNLTASDNAAEYAIRVNDTPLTGMSWKQQINLEGELDPTGGKEQRPVTIWAYATDDKGFISSPEVIKVLIDQGTPIIEQDIKLVQWKESYTGSTYFTFENGKIVLDSGAAKAVRSYNGKENIKDEWFIIGKVRDESGLKDVTFKVNDETTGYGVTTYGGTYTNPATKAFIHPVYEKNSSNKDVYNYLFCIPIGNAETNEVGSYTIHFEATENEEAEKYVSRDFEVLYDNKAPEVPVKLKLSGREIEENTTVDIYNSNKKFTFGGKATEEKVGSASQTGVERIAFYFTRDIKNQETQIFDVMIKNGTDNGNHRSYASGSGLTKEDKLYWQSATVKVTNTDLTITNATYDFTNIHVGGLAKVNGVIYRIQAVNESSKKISISGAPGDTTGSETTAALFAIANVVDNPTRESEGTEAAATSGYGYGYYKDGGKDGDLMVESLISTDNINFNWEANINTKNMSDGPVTLHYVVFDKAGNASAEQTIECTVKNNAPRLAGVTLGTDTNGNGVVDDTETYSEYVTEYAGMYNQGYSNNGKTKMTSLTVPTGSTKENPVSVFKIKGKTIIKPEIVGGNGALSYSYKVSKRNAENDDWVSPAYKTITSDAFTLGTGTADTDEVVKVNNKLPEIVIDVKDFLGNGIENGANQKFEFIIEDKTPGKNNAAGQATVAAQSASLNIIMSMDLIDKTPAKNKIIPFYWKSATENSLKDNSKEKGHIELSDDWTIITGGTGENAKVWGDKDPKVSGAFKLEGIAQDDVLLSELYVDFANVKLDGTNTNTLIAQYSTATGWTPKHTDAAKWSAEVRRATYAEFIDAGSPGLADPLTEATLPEGKTLSDSVPEISQEYGHVVHWTLTLDTDKLGLLPKADMVINVSAKDRGKPKLENGVVKYESNDFVADTASTYKIDLVPYITKVKTWLSGKTSKTDASEYNRTALGHYPVKAGEKITISGFNLGGDKEYTVGTTQTSGEISLTVSNIDTLNNKNNNDAKGINTSVVADYTDDTTTSDILKNFYNRTPNDTNNFTLTDDVYLDVWSFNSNVAQPTGGGRIDEVSMKINPNKKTLGYAFLNSFNNFAAPGNNKAYEAKGAEIPGNGTTYNNNGTVKALTTNQDFRSTATLTYGWDGKAYATDAGGGEGQRIHFWIIDTNGTDSGVDIEFINQHGTRDQTTGGTNYDLRYKMRSPSIATSRSTNNSTNIYMAYYDSFNDEIRFKSGNTTNLGLFTQHGRIGKNNDPLATDSKSNYPRYNCDDAQVIATNAGKNLPNGNGYKYTGSPLGGAGEFVAIDVIPAGTVINGATQGLANDVVVIVWYDAVAKTLKYSFNENPRDITGTTGSTNNANYKGLNRKNWAGVSNNTYSTTNTTLAQTIFTGAGEYCQIKVDQQGGVHIAAFDPIYGDLRYAYLETYNTPYTEASMSYIVDSNGNTGSHLVMDVAYDKAPASGGKPVPYITYWGSGMPKIAHPANNCASTGANNELFTGNWEVSYIPTTSTISDLDQKKLNNLDNRINVALYKYGTNGAVVPMTQTYPVVGYSIAKDSTDDRIETAQMQ